MIDGINGYLVNEHDVENLAAKIAYLIDHNELWEQFGLNGRKLIEEKFDRRKKAEELEGLLDTLA